MKNNQPTRKERGAKPKRHGQLIAILIVIVILAVLVFGFAIRKISTRLENSQQSSQSSSSLTSEQIQQIKQRRAFVNQVAASSIKVYQNDYHVLPSIVTAQAILESDWGNSKLYKVANNPFGIKGSYKGQSISYDTTEYENGKNITVVAKFRKYPNLEAAIKDHDESIKTHFIKQTNVTSYVKAANLLQKNVYATDPQYASKLISVIEEYNLERFDLQALNNN
ncbi:glucosaminidase domain-containing protein [Nicoliella spurrieriana]|uniref:Glucosaminidase domain-containing protein n=1 Tax=Nicoliella spurrieriana TaxID=2925830 RepID=A0A976RSS3_9LACO|nr:glucosaminidase domain-containing protein [Nicoliella spurrieriana]UQS87139.1 glucosaminidase domain-containing protein [Nicoliella spurrieriana]